MKAIYLKPMLICLPLVLLIIESCNTGRRNRLPENFNYRSFQDSIRAITPDSIGDEANLFDSTAFDPGTDSAEMLLTRIDSLWHRDLRLMQQFDSLMKIWKKSDKNSPEDLAAIRENISVLDSFLFYKDSTLGTACTKQDCLLYADVNKTKQLLFLYLDGELVDSFAVSTGIKSRETPDMNVRPSGPLLMKYTSKKFPGGNYEGLGNMPYAVFIRGGYAIHGTTRGNFSKLGSRASHGCIRLHPTNARIFYELVKKIGLRNTWVTVED